MTDDPNSAETLQRLLDQQIKIARAITQSDSSTIERVSKEYGIDSTQLNESHETLIRKRTSQTATSLPMSSRAMGSSFRQEFRSFAKLHHFNEPSAIARDAIEFAQYMLRRYGKCNEPEAPANCPENSRLEAQAKERPFESPPPWLVDCLNWELALHEWRCKRLYWKRLRLSYDLMSWKNSSVSSPVEKTTTVVLWKCGGYGRIWL